MKPIFTAAGVVALVVLSVVAWRGHKSATALREENSQLQARLAEQDGDRKSAATPADEPPPVVTSELMKLRGEVAQLRRQTNDLEKLQRENSTLKSALAVAKEAAAKAAAQAQSRPAGSQQRQTEFVPREAWAFAGYATPEDTLKSVTWAMSVGELNTFLGSLSPAERARTEEQWKNKTEAEITAEARREMEKLPGFHIVDKQTVSPDEVIVRVFGEGDENDVRSIRMKRMGSEWKFDGVAKVRKREAAP